MTFPRRETNDDFISRRAETLAHEAFPPADPALVAQARVDLITALHQLGLTRAPHRPFILPKPAWEKLAAQRGLYLLTLSPTTWLRYGAPPHHHAWWLGLPVAALVLLSFWWLPQGLSPNLVAAPGLVLFGITCCLFVGHWHRKRCTTWEADYEKARQRALVIPRFAEPVPHEGPRTLQAHVFFPEAFDPYLGRRTRESLRLWAVLPAAGLRVEGLQGAILDPHFAAPPEVHVRVRFGGALMLENEAYVALIQLGERPLYTDEDLGQMLQALTTA